MKSIVQYINERGAAPTLIEREMKVWKQRIEDDFGKELKHLQWLIMDENLYKTEKKSDIVYEFTPFDDYVNAYAMSGNRQFCYNKIRNICVEYDFTDNKKVNDVLEKLKSLI